MGSSANQILHTHETKSFKNKIIEMTEQSVEEQVCTLQARFDSANARISNLKAMVVNPLKHTQEQR